MKKAIPITKIRENAKEFGFGDHGLKVLMQRVLWKNEKGEVIETPGDMFRRAADAIAGAEKLFKTPSKEIHRIRDDFFEIMSSQDFISNRILVNAGRKYPYQQFAACYVFPIEDSLDNIFTILQRSAFIQKWDAAAGIDYSVLRPRGALISSTGGRSSGPVSFMTLFDKMSEVISEGSLRRGANMGVLRIDHPDILEFIEAKRSPGVLEYFNLSVGITDKFMDALANDTEYPLINPKGRKIAKKIKARFIWNKIVDSAWRTGDPGLIFLDEINRRNPTPHIGKITAVNLCGEQPLLPWESCILGNIKLSNFAVFKGGKLDIDWSRLKRVVELSVRFLDNAIEINHYFYKEIERIVKHGNRKIGLGILGFADLLLMLGIPYDSKEGLQIAEKLMGFIHNNAIKASIALGKERGNFPNFKGSTWGKKGYRHMRNACVTTIAPTGTVCVIADASSGIEPIYALSYTRSGLGSDVKHKEEMFFLNKYLIEALKKEWLYSEELMHEIIKKGSLKDIKGIPQEIKKIFVTSMEISPEWHIQMQAAFQKYTDSAVTKTVNLPSAATRSDVEKAYLLAYKLKCKGITIYRDRSRKEQVLVAGK